MYEVMERRGKRELNKTSSIIGACCSWHARFCVNTELWRQWGGKERRLLLKQPSMEIYSGGVFLILLCYFLLISCKFKWSVCQLSPPKYLRPSWRLVTELRELVFNKVIRSLHTMMQIKHRLDSLHTSCFLVVFR